MILSTDISSTNLIVAFVSADTQHLFNPRESDWGFTSFMPLSKGKHLSPQYFHSLFQLTDI